MNKKMTNSKKNSSYYTHLMENLRDPVLAVEYLNAALEEEDDADPTLFMRALKNVADAWGFSHLADQTGLDRAGLYKMLTEHGNPRLGSLHRLLDAMGLRIAIARKNPAA
jgi:probable addiction module antidote protein